MYPREGHTPIPSLFLPLFSVSYYSTTDSFGRWLSTNNKNSKNSKNRKNSMSFTGKYLLESQENYEEFLEAIGLLSAKTDHKVVTEVVQDGDHFTWTQSIPNWTWSNEFTVGKECELQTMTGSKFTVKVTMDGGKIIIQFPQYLFTAEIVDDKLIMHCTITGDTGLTFKRVNTRT